MKNDFNPEHLDVRVFAEASASLSGTTPLVDLPRLREALYFDGTDSNTPTVTWHVSGEARTRKGASTQAWLTLQAQATAPLECQRCLGTVHTALEFDRQFQFADTEEAAAELDAQEEDDVLVISRNFNLLSLIEDELLLALPVVPRHDACPQPLPMSTQADASPADADATTEKPNPFAKLAGLKIRGDKAE
jgi:uncharacterized protein